VKISNFYIVLLTFFLCINPQITLAQTYERLIQQGKNASASGDFIQAEAIWRKVLQQNPNDANVRVFLGRALRLQERLDEALAEYQKAIALKPQNPYAWNGLGNTFADQGKLNDAIAAYRKAIEIDKKFGFAYTGLGNIMYAQKKYNEAIRYYLKAVEIDPKDPIPRNNLEELKRDIALQRNPQYTTSQQSQQQTQIVISSPGTYQIVTNLPEKPLPAPLASIVKVVAQTSFGPSYGTGWVLTKQGNRVWIVTNRHVVTDSEGNRQPSKKISVEFYSTNEVRPRLPAKIANITKNNDFLDLAVLEVMDVPSSDIDSLQLSSTKVSLNTPLRVIGHPNVDIAADWTVETGEISNIADKQLQLSKFSLHPGNSGSPVLDRQNHVVGVVFRIANEPREGKTGTAGFGYAYPIELVKNQLRNWGYAL
jgi:Tfp pilus assembly protein PilF/V8-like Glu-specific endopeptidase